MILSVFITVISGHDKPQPPGCLLGNTQPSAPLYSGPLYGTLLSFICTRTSIPAS
ncbi:hypothetical protein QE67_004605 [Salmonella enterica subsp. enterica]|nr:hypothetical protein [Salmonella enterica subsp. enterica]